MRSAPIAAPMSWQPELELFEDWLRAAGLPPSTRRIRLYHVRRFASVTGLDPYEVRLADLLGFIASHEWAANTRASHRASFRAFYRWAVDAGRIAESPAEKMPTVQAPLGRPRPASEAAVQRALDDADERVRLMVRLGATVGLRCGEIAQVHSGNLIRDSGGYSLRVLGKGAKVRIVPIGDELAAEIAAASGFAFPGQIDGHISAGYVSKLVSRTLPPGVTAHMLRHRFASRAFAGSLNIRAVQELLGHASVATTQIYTAVDDTELRRAATAAA